MADDPTKAAGDGQEGVIQADQGSIPAQIQNAPHPTIQTHTLKKGDETVEVTTEKLIEMAQKGWNADSRTQAAAEQAKRAEAALELQAEINEVMESEDADAFRRLGEKLNVPEEEIERIVDEYWEGEDGDVAPVDDGPIGVERMAPDVQRALQVVERQRIKEIVDAALDNDEVVRYNMEQRDAKGKEAIRNLVNDKVRGRLVESNGDFGDGNRILREILPEVRQHLEALGIPRKPNTLGFGPAPGGGDTEVYPEQRPKYVSSSEGPDWEEHITEELRFRAAEIERSKQ
jgi:RNA-binding protein YhbY